MPAPSPLQFGGTSFGYQGTAPPYAAKLLEDKGQVKQKLQCIDKNKSCRRTA